MKKFLTYLLIFCTLCLFPAPNTGLSASIDENRVEAITPAPVVIYANKMHVNSIQWNSHYSGSAHFKGAVSNTTWHNGYYWNTLYIYGESTKGGVPKATYITNFKIHLITPYGDNVIYQDRYLLINYRETRAVSSLYNSQPNAQYFITWDTCTSF